MSTRRSAIAKPVVFVLLLLAAACTTSSSGGLSEEPASLEVQVWGGRAENAVYRALVGFVELEHPELDISLTQSYSKDDHLAKLVTSLAAGDPPDVFLVNFREFSQFVTQGAIQAIEPLLGKTNIDSAAYYPAVLEAFTYDGLLQCIPQNISSLVAYVNRTLFRSAGLKIPVNGWSWDEFRETAIRLTGNGVHGLGIEPEIIRIAPFVWSNGGDLVDDLSAPTRFKLDDPPARAALEFLISLVRDDRVVPNEEEAAAQDLETRFMAGKLGIFLSSRRVTTAFRERPELDWDVVPLPVAKQSAGILHSDAFCLSREADLKQALRFIQYAAGERGQRVLAASGRTVPSLKSVSRSSVFLDPTQRPKHNEVFLENIASIRRTPVIPTWPEIEELAAEIIRRAFYEPGYELDDALEELDAATKDLFEEGSR